MLFQGEARPKGTIEFVVTKADGRTYDLGQSGTWRFKWRVAQMKLGNDIRKLRAFLRV